MLLPYSLMALGAKERLSGSVLHRGGTIRRLKELLVVKVVRGIVRDSVLGGISRR